MSDVIEYPAPDLSLIVPPETAWQRERRAFRRCYRNCEQITTASTSRSRTESRSQAARTKWRLPWRPMLALVTDLFILVMSAARRYRQPESHRPVDRDGRSRA